MKHAQSIHSQRPYKQLGLLIIVKHTRFSGEIKEGHAQTEIRKLAYIRKVSETMEDPSKDFGIFHKMYENIVREHFGKNCQ